MIRIRSKSLNEGHLSASGSSPYLVRTYRPNSPPSPTEGNANQVLIDRYTVVGQEIMEDSVGPHLEDRQVIHTKIRKAFEPSFTYAHTGGHSSAGSWAHYYTSPAFGLSKLNQFIGDYQVMPHDGSYFGQKPSFVSTNDDAEVQKLYKRARDPVVQGLVNLVEARQIPSALQSLAETLPKSEQRYRKFSQALKKAKLTKRFSNSYLAYQFGIKPLIDDICKVNGFLDNSSQGFASFRNGDNHHLGSVFTGSFAVPPSETAISGSPSKFVHVFTCDELKPTTRYSLTYRYKKILPGTFVDRAQFILNRLGFLSPAEAAWELIPWSFVVDWFIDTSGLLMSIDDMLGFDPIQTISLTKSASWKGKIDSTHYVYGQTSNNLVRTASAATTSLSYYWRSPLGRSTYVGPSKRFGNKQVLLSVALARQRLRGRELY